MAKNQQILEALQGLNLDDPATKVAKFKALDALMRVDPADATKFRKTVLEHRAIFPDPANLFRNELEGADTFLLPAGELGQNNGLRVLQQAAAATRIKLGMRSMPLEGLREIASAASLPVLRDLLATKTQFFGDLGRCFRWGVNTAAPLDLPLVTDVELGNIKARAAQLAIQNITDSIAAVEAENTASNNLLNPAIVAIRAAGPVLDASLQTAIDQLTSMTEKLEELQAVMTANAAIVRPATDPDQNRVIVERVAAIAEQLRLANEAAKPLSLGIIAEKSRAIIDAVARVNMDTADHVALAAVKKAAEANYLSLGKALELATLSATKVELVGPTIEVDNAERALVKVSVNYFAKLAVAKALAIEAKTNEIIAYTGPDENRRNEMLGAAESLLRAAQKAYDDAINAKLKAHANLFERAADEETRIDDVIAGAKEALRKAKEAIGPVRILISPPTDTVDFGDMYIEHNSLIEEFTHTVVKISESELASVTGGAKPLPPGALNVAADKQTTLERVQLGLDKRIESTAVFPDEAHPGQTVTSKLTQDHTGKVTNMTTDILSQEQQEKEAIETAALVLKNYKPGSGNIIIRGDAMQAQKANMVYAALLRLMEDNPTFNSVKVESRVPDCIGPVDRFFKTHGMAKTAFINTHLPKTAALLKLEKEQVNQFSTVQAHRSGLFQGMKEQLNEIVDHGQKLEKAKQMHDQGLKEGEEITLEGKIPSRRGP